MIAVKRRGAGHWLLLAGLVAAGSFVGVLVGAAGWSLLAEPLPPDGSGNGRNSYTWGVVGGLIGVTTGASVAVLVHLRLTSSQTRRPLGPYPGDP